MKKAWLIAVAALASCGDVESDLITRVADGPTRCEKDDDCPTTTPRCEIDSARCVECLASSDCSAGQACALPAGRCVPGCPQAPCPLASPVCVEATGLCRGCSTNTECPQAAPYCQEATGHCVECLEHANCFGELNICDATGRCVECTEAGHCSGDETCSPLKLCAVRCGQNGACPAEDPICDVDIGFCVECRRDDDCPDLEDVCRNSDCVDRVTGQ